MLFPHKTRLTMKRAGLNQLSRSCRPSVYGRRRNHCVIVPAKVGRISNALERREHTWFVRTNDVSDLTVIVGEDSFHLHKVHLHAPSFQIPMLSKSGYLNKLVFNRMNNEAADSSISMHIDNLPGGCQIFQLVVKFCYGVAVDLTATNVAPLYCAAYFLEMTEDFGHGNLISKAQAFLSFIIFSSWRDTFNIFTSCEDVSFWAQELGIVKQCSESIAWKACLDPQAIGRVVNDDELCFKILTNNNNSKNKDGGASEIVEECWWFKDVSVLRIDHFVEAICAIKTKGATPRLVGNCIAYWTSKWLQKFKLHSDSREAHRDTIESLIRVLPNEKNSVCCNFLLHLLKAGWMLNIDHELTTELEKRVAMMLECCCAGDLIVKNYRENDTVYDVSLVIRVVQAYATHFTRDLTSGMRLAATVVDDYLALVARDDMLSVKAFQLLVEALPADARHCNDKLYRAIDMYLKAHPKLTEEDRRIVSRAMEYHKLSKEAREHAMKNDRLPLNIVARLTLSEQVNATKSILSNNLKYRRSESEETVRATRGIDNSRWFKYHKKLQMMKAEVEKMKLQVCSLQVCKVELQRQMRIAPK
ncbi:hypothetical protein IFM89_017516 [Coptis chinensis]|uniref:Root phototropism protein 3 n=1 Tax=Coptis chinensis TaxID=261450 RepID=A0A835LUK5_9MAGN|nr:hypothetical protein IFM89_017516 [Coptis chinensis]